MFKLFLLFEDNVGYINEFLIGLKRYPKEYPDWICGEIPIGHK